MSDKLIFRDRVYGELEFGELVIADLIKTLPMQRLKGVRQGGPVYYIDKRFDVNRFEHSIGVCYLLRLFGASREEQIAGLLHDISHTAFSHVADYVFPNKHYEFHDEFFHKVIENSEIPEILARHDLEVRVILERKDFHLLDANLPDLSADRLDYSFRDLKNYGLFTSEEVMRSLRYVKVRDDKFYFSDIGEAKNYAIKFLIGDAVLWRHPASAKVFELLSGAIRRAFDLGVMSAEDFYGVDDEVLEFLNKQSDSEIRGRIAEIKSGNYYSFALENEAEWEVPAKIRFVNPYVLSNHGGLARLSEVDPTMREWLNFYSTVPRSVRIKKVDYRP